MPQHLSTSFPGLVTGLESQISVDSLTGQEDRVYVKFPKLDSYMFVGLVYSVSATDRNRWVGVFTMDDQRFELPSATKRDAVDKIILMAAAHKGVPVSNLTKTPRQNPNRLSKTSRPISV